jgi:multidrug efflux pump subunit AcrA (membrane-fusion protein)
MIKRSYLLLPLLIWACNNEPKQDIPVAKVRTETFYVELNEEGEVKATNSILISSPTISWRYGSLKITQLVEDGKEVAEGDTVVVFDPSEVKKAIVDAESRLEIHKAELERMKAQQQSDMEELMADYEITKLSQEISKIRFESSDYEAEIKKREIQLNLEKANIALERAKAQIDNRKKIQQEEITQKMLSIRQAQLELDDSHATMDKLFVRTPSPGIAIIRNNWSSDAKFQVGDQVWSGYPMIELPDMNEIKADVLINEVDVSKIRKGLKVQIRPDAFSDSVYSGEVLSVANLAINKDNRSKIKVFPVEILIQSGKHSLMPGLTVSCRIIVDEIPNATFVPLESLFREGDAEFVYVKTPTGFKKQEVKTGLSNTDFIIVQSGLKGDEQIAMTNPFAETDNKEKTEQP